jgi:hypothetical protein
MRTTPALWMLALLSAPALAGALAPNGVLPCTVQDHAAEFEALEKSQEEAEAAWYEVYKAAPADGRRALMDKRSALYVDYAGRFAALAAKAKGTEVGAKSDVRVVALGLNTGDEAVKAQVKAAADELLELYIGSEALAEFAGMLGRAASQLGEEYCLDALHRLLEKSPHAKVQAPALFALAQKAMGEADDDPAKVAEARKLFEKIAAKYADVPYRGTKTYGSAATATLFELDHLQIGMIAPDFETSDENGAKFKLSDYRGKVVVLDFWGLW